MRKKEKRELTAIEKRNRAAVILAIYAVFFIVLIIFILTSEKDEKQINDPKEEIITERLRVSNAIDKYIKNNNYRYEYSFGDDFEIKGEVDKDKNMIKKIFNDKETTYFINDEYYYIKDKEKYKKINSVYLYEEYEDVFTNIKNVAKLFEGVKKSDLEYDNNITKKTFNIDLEDYLDIYNSINLTKYTDKKNIEVDNSIEYTDDYIIINLDVSDLYNVTQNLNKEIIYTFKIYDVDEVALNW